MSCFLCTIQACVKFSPIMAQWQLLGARKHEGGGEKGMQQERQGGEKVKRAKKKIWWLTNKMKNLKI